jgi:hypothetical protein
MSSTDRWLESLKNVTSPPAPELFPRRRLRSSNLCIFPLLRCLSQKLTADIRIPFNEPSGAVERAHALDLPSTARSSGCRSSGSCKSLPPIACLVRPHTFRKANGVAAGQQCLSLEAQCSAAAGHSLTFLWLTAPQRQPDVPLWAWRAARHRPGSFHGLCIRVLPTTWRTARPGKIRPSSRWTRTRSGRRGRLAWRVSRSTATQPTMRRVPKPAFRHRTSARTDRSSNPRTTGSVEPT